MMTPSDKIGGTMFTAHDALWLPRWSRMARTDEYNEKIWRNIVGICYTVDHVAKEFGWKIIVTSMFRPKEYNSLVGGSPNSRHMRGMAMDFKVEGMPCDDVRDILRPNLARYCLRMEDEPGYAWIHVDTDGIGPFKVK